MICGPLVVRARAGGRPVRRRLNGMSGGAEAVSRPSASSRFRRGTRGRKSPAAPLDDGAGRGTTYSGASDVDTLYYAARTRVRRPLFR